LGENFMLLLDKKHRAIHQWLAGELAEVETRFSAELTCDLGCVNDLARHVERYRGKMLRPMLLLLCGNACSDRQEVGEDHRTLAGVVEMVHMATLVHDDILDEADVRRQGKTVNHLRGNETAVMLGDYLISHAYHLCSSLNSQAAARLIARATNTVCEGELLQLANRDNWSLDEQTYYQIIRRKTASLVGVSCQLGAMFSGAPRPVCDTMARFGEQIGMAFQIVDDVLDLTGEPAVVGKTLGRDLEKGKLTLPLIHRLERANKVEHQLLLSLLRSEGPDRATQIGQLLAASDSVRYARRQAERLVEEARSACTVLNDGDARQALLATADAIVERQR
jgi:octaprenyl-diphosphate synthase